MSDAGIGIIRVSGPDAISIVDNCYLNAHKEHDLMFHAAGTIQYGYFCDYREEIIDEIIKSGNKVGTIDDIVQEYHVEFDKILSNGVIELIGEDKIKIHSVCNSFEGDMENVDRIEYDKYRDSLRK